MIQNGKNKKVHITKQLGICIFTVFIMIMAAIILLHHNPFADAAEETTKKIIACVILLVCEVFFVLLYDKITVLPIELWQNRRLIWKLAKNDFKTRYAGSYLGIVWAFVQPVVTVLLYWFVFGTIMQSRAKLAGNIEAPYVLWLTAGLVPWFYFSEAINNGTTALLEYSYLVKKVVFKISILPIIKIIAATFIHIFFVAIMLVFYVLYGGYALDVHLLQLIYFSFCMFVFVLACSYATCAIVIFFRDLTQIVNIVLQVGMWGTPILWNLADFEEKYPQYQTFFQIFFKGNPVFYIVNGYRSALFEKTWFWQDFYSTMYFWIVTVVIFGVGALVFKRLKVHFADVL